MPSDVDIANLALTQLGANRITTFNDTTKEARSINQVYVLQRDNELRAHRWNFAIKRQQLAASVTAPPFGYSLSYPLPNDYLSAIAVGDFAPGAELAIFRGGLDDPMYRIEGNAILWGPSGTKPTTATPIPLNLRYIARITDPMQFDPCFVVAFACRLAVTCAEIITQQTSKKADAQQEYKTAIMLALRANAIEVPSEQSPDGSWIRSRLPG